MENQELQPYNFALRPEDHQPSGVCDFSKIYTPKDLIIRFGNKSYPMDRRVTRNRNGMETVRYSVTLEKLKQLEMQGDAQA